MRCDQRSGLVSVLLPSHGQHEGVIGAEEAVISTPNSKIEVRVIPTNEEIIIARNAWQKLSTLN